MVPADLEESLVTGSPGKVKKTYGNLEEIEQKLRTMSES